MNIWDTGKRGALFVPGRDAPEAAAETASACSDYIRDYEEECLSDDEITCYNCRYRRWTQTSFECLRK